MAHPFGDLLRQYRARKHGLTQARLAMLAGYDPALVTKMCQGRKELAGPSGRERVVRLISVLHDEGLLTTLDEANALLSSAGMPPLFAGQPAEANVIGALRPSGTFADGRQAAEAKPGRAPVPHNLPAQLTSFVGREREIAAVTQLLGTTRLLTLTGSGGCGKTRLALEVGAGVVWLVEFAPLTDPAGVPRQVAEVFHLPEDPGRSWMEVLIEHLAGRHVLLLLDNCEHLIAACAELAEALLRACPDLRVLATSQEALGLPGEVVWRVPSLTTPATDSPQSLEQLAGYEAIRLFVARAAAVQPGFQLTAANVAAVAQICVQLDGIPLAIEMAAAQVAAMSIQELAARLKDRFTLLANAHRTALPRHRTLRATLEWSVQLLAEPERFLLARLSVFADGWTAELAQAVCADDSLSAADVLPLLLNLVRKSLVVADTRSERTRYHLLETVRQYAAERLAEHGETDATYRHLAMYLTEPPPRIGGFPIDEWSSQFTTEVGNIRHLFVWARTQPDGAVTILRLANAYATVSYNFASLAEPLAWLEEGLAYGDAVPMDVRIKAIHQKLGLYLFTGYNMGRWLAEAEEMVALGEHFDTDFDRGTSMNMAGMAAVGRGDLDKAEEWFERERVYSRRVSFAYGIGLSYIHQALLRVARGDGASAAALLHESYQLGYGPELLNVLFLRTACTLWVNMDEARERLEREIPQDREAGASVNWWFWAELQLLTQALLFSGDYARAADCAQESLELARASQHPWSQGFGEAEALLELGRIAWLQGDPAAARSYGEQCQELYRRVGDVEHVAQAHLLIGCAALAQGNLRGAEDSLNRGLTLFRDLQQPAGEVAALAALASLAEARGEIRRAARLYGAADVPPQTLLLWLSWSIWTVRLASRVIYDRQIATARSRCIDPAFAAAWAEGQQMTHEQAVAYALQASQAEKKADEPHKRLR